MDAAVKHAVCPERVEAAITTCQCGEPRLGIRRIAIDGRKRETPVQGLPLRRLRCRRGRFDGMSRMIQMPNHFLVSVSPSVGVMVRATLRNRAKTLFQC